MSEKKTTSKKVHTLTLEDQTTLAQANVKKMEQGKIEVMKVVEGVQGAEKLAELILQMKAEIASLRSGTSMEYPDGVSPKKKAIAAYLREHPGVTSKSMIARELQMDRTTVQRYYDEVQAELRGDESPAMQM